MPAGRVFCIGYADAQELLRAEDCKFYTAGVYGWNSDVYFFDDVAISTGYRPFGKEIDRERLKEYESKARAIWDSSANYYEKRDEVKRLCAEWLREEIKAQREAK